MNIVQRFVYDLSPWVWSTRAVQGSFGALRITSHGSRRVHFVPSQ